jgi:hypothetical protein
LPLNYHKTNIFSAASPPRRVCMNLSESPNSKDQPKPLQSQDSLEDQDENENSENDIENDNNNEDVDAEQNITGVSCFRVQAR